MALADFVQSWVHSLRDTTELSQGRELFYLEGCFVRIKGHDFANRLARTPLRRALRDLPVKILIIALRHLFGGETYFGGAPILPHAVQREQTLDTVDVAHALLGQSREFAVWPARIPSSTLGTRTK